MRDSKHDIFEVVGYKPPVAVPNYLAKDRKISLRGLGLIVYMLMVRSGDCTKLRKRFGVSQKVLGRVLRELKAAGHVKLFSCRTPGGNWAGSKWRLSIKEVLDGKAQKGNSAARPKRETGYCSNNNINTSPRVRGEGGLGIKVIDVDIKRWCLLLEDYLRSKRVFDANTSKKIWEKQFTMLLKDVGSKKRISDVLTHYIERSDRQDSQYAPKVYGAKDFRNKFYRIEDWVKKDRAPTGEDDQDDLKRQHAKEIDEIAAWDAKIAKRRRKVT